MRSSTSATDAYAPNNSNAGLQQIQACSKFRRKLYDDHSRCSAPANCKEMKLQLTDFYKYRFYNTKPRLRHRTWNSRSCTNLRRVSSLSFYSFLLFNFALIPALVEITNFGTPFSLRTATACHPGHTGVNRRFPRKMTPFVLRQHVPNVSEKTIGASGPSEGKITKDSKRFNDELISNWNPNIVFKDEEQTNADRLMTERCRDRLNRLAIMVSTHWEGEVGLRVTEAWDEDGAHEPDSLHYEGRAVDITTTDTDKSKYGMLARLAVEAGFDWVFYESRAHVHCSVKSENSDAAIYGGCFPGDSLAYHPNGEPIKISQLLPGDCVLAMDNNGNVIKDRILTFMDSQLPITKGRNEQRISHTFVQIRTEDGNTIRLTRNHLIFISRSSDISDDAIGVSAEVGSNNRQLQITSNANNSYPNNGNSRGVSRQEAIFAENVEVGDYVYVMKMDMGQVNTLVSEQVAEAFPVRVISATVTSANTGAFAPLTAHGTLIVDRVAASCYAVLDNHVVAHWVMAPLRYYHMLVNWWRAEPGRAVVQTITDHSIVHNNEKDSNCTTQYSIPRYMHTDHDGIHWYPRIWYKIASFILPQSLIKPF